MADAALTIAIGNHGLSHALKSGQVETGELRLDFVEIEPVTKAMRRMVRGLDFDICEMAFTTYLCAKDLGVPITAIPVFLTRNFHHWAAFVHANAGIHAPKDLEGRRVAVNRGYTVTTGLWVRGILQDEYGVDLSRITWVPTDEEHVAGFGPPANVDVSRRGRDAAELLLCGDCAGAIGDIKSASPDIRPLIADARRAGLAAFAQTGVYPLNHGVVVRDSVLAARPSIAAALYKAFASAKAIHLASLGSAAAASPVDAAALEVRAALGIDPFAFGVAANRTALEAIVGHAVRQNVISRPIAIDALFAPATLDL